MVDIIVPEDKDNMHVYVSQGVPEILSLTIVGVLKEGIEKFYIGLVRCYVARDLHRVCKVPRCEGFT